MVTISKKELFLLYYLFIHKQESRVGTMKQKSEQQAARMLFTDNTLLIGKYHYIPGPKHH